MALKGLDIFKLTPKTNCKECGSPTCMAFAMKVAQGAVEISKCPHMSEEALATLSEATAPPMKTIKVPESAQAIMPNVVLPLIASVGVALVAVLLAGPLSAINLAIIDWLTVMCQEDSNRIIMAVVLGAMIGFDMGGPVNKAAWTATNALMLAGIYTPCVYTNLAITIPPLGYAIASVIRKDRFSDDLRNSAAGNWVMSFIGITEGAIPFTLVKPTRLIPINVIGSALGAGIGAAFGTIAEIPPLGGWYGFITMVNPWGYLLGIAIGGLFIAFASTALVNFREEKEEDVSEDDIEISFE